ncbi:MAG: hypothetical protein WA667_07750 [Candidatus Nitrosopolaris sp.]
MTTIAAAMASNKIIADLETSIDTLTVGTLPYFRDIFRQTDESNITEHDILVSAASHMVVRHTGKDLS